MAIEQQARGLKIAVAHPALGRGGSEARALWCLQALKAAYDVTLLTTGRVDLPALNRYYGTDIRADEIRIRTPAPCLGSMLTARTAALRGAWFQRFCRSVAPEFAVLISVYNLCDFGRPALHFLADFSWDDELRRTLHPTGTGLRGVFHGATPWRRWYLRLVRSVGKPSGRNLLAGEDLVIANSQWSAELLKTRYGLTAPVVYPPVLGPAPETTPAWEQREDGFVCLGRLSPEKRVEEAVEIMRAVRQATGADLHLHVLGDPLHSPYGRRLQTLAAAAGPWVRLEGEVSGRQKWELLARHRYGIHACRGEAFGIAVAEMIRAGLVPFVPAMGGVQEIVAAPALEYTDSAEATRKIAAVLQDPGQTTALRAHLARQAQQFSTARFVEGLHSVLAQFIERWRLVPL